MRPQVSALVAACHSAACRPPGSGGTGGSTKGAGGGASPRVNAKLARRIRDVQKRGRAVQAVANRQRGSALKRDIEEANLETARRKVVSNVKRAGGTERVKRMEAADSPLKGRIRQTDEAKRIRRANMEIEITDANRAKVRRQAELKKAGVSYSPKAAAYMKKNGFDGDMTRGAKVTSETPKNHRALTKRAKSEGKVVFHGPDGKYSIISPEQQQSAFVYDDGSWRTTNGSGAEVHYGNKGYPVFGPGRTVRGKIVPTSHD